MTEWKIRYFLFHRGRIPRFFHYEVLANFYFYQFNFLESRIKDHATALVASGLHEEPTDPTVASQVTSLLLKYEIPTPHICTGIPLFFHYNASANLCIKSLTFKCFSNYYLDFHFDKGT